MSLGYDFRAEHRNELHKAHFTYRNLAFYSLYAIATPKPCKHYHAEGPYGVSGFVTRHRRLHVLLFGIGPLPRHSRRQ